jgi:hypothetical protein
MKRMIGVCAAAVLSVGWLSACGGDDSSDSAGTPSFTTSTESSDNGGGGSGDYCAAIQDAKHKFGGNVNFDASDLTDAVNTIHEIAGIAPDSVSAEWATIDDALIQLVNALHDAGLDPADITNPSSMQSLAHDPQKRHEIEKIAKSFDTQAINAAGNRIDDEVRADCGFSISGSN